MIRGNRVVVVDGVRVEESAHLLELIRKASKGNYGYLQELIVTVKFAVVENQRVHQSVLLKNGDFLVVLSKSFGTNNHALEVDALAILIWIANNGTSQEVELVIKSPVIPTLLATMNSQQKNVRGESLHLLRLLSEHDSSVAVFARAELLSTLRKVARQTTKLNSLLNINYICCNYFRTGFLLKKAVTDRATLPPVKEAFQELMSVLCAVIHTGDKDMIETVKLFVDLYSGMDGTAEIIRASGILSRLSSQGKSKTEELPTAGVMRKISNMQLKGDDSPMDCARLFAAITEVGTGSAKSRNEKKLQQISSSVKHYLGGEKEQKQAFIANLLSACDGLGKFVLACVKPNYNHTVHLTGIEIAEAIMCGDNEDLKEELLASGGLIPAVTALLARGDQGVCEKALETLKLFCEGSGSLEWTWKVTDQLRNPSILPSLISLAKKPENKAWASKIGWIFIAFCIGDQRQRCEHEMAEMCKSAKLKGAAAATTNPGPPVQYVRDITTLSKILLKAGDVDVTNQVLMSLTIIVSTEGCHRTIFESGVLPMAFKHILVNNSLQFIAGNFIMMAAIGGGLATSNVRILEFFKAVKRSQGMKYFHNIIVGVDGRNVEDDRATVRGLNNFFERLTVALFPQPTAEVVTKSVSLDCKIADALLESGFTHALVKCLEDGFPTPVRCRKLAEYIVVCLSNSATEVSVKFLVEAGTVAALVSLLQDCDRNTDCFHSVISGISCLAAKSVAARDEIVESGGLSQLFALMHEYRGDVGKLRDFFECLCSIMHRKPIACARHFEQLPECLRTILTEENLEMCKRESEACCALYIEMVCECIQKFAWYGAEQVEQLGKNGMIKFLVSVALNIKEDQTQEAAILAVMRMCLNKEDCRDAFVKLGILDHLPRLLKSPLKAAKRATVLLMGSVFQKNLTRAQRRAAEEAMRELC